MDERIYGTIFTISTSNSSQQLAVEHEVDLIVICMGIHDAACGRSLLADLDRWMHWRHACATYSVKVISAQGQLVALRCLFQNAR